MNYFQEPHTRCGDFATAAFLTLAEGERTEAATVLRQLTGFDEDAVDLRNGRELRTKLAKLAYKNQLFGQPSRRHPHLLSAYRRQAYVLGVLGVMMSEEAAAMDAALQEILTERGD